MRAPERIVIGLVGILFVWACLLPCVDCGPEVLTSDPGGPDLEAGRHFGLTILLLGWGGGNHGVPWSANVFLALGLLCLAFRRHRAAGVRGIVASCLGLTTWALNGFSRPCGYDPMVGYYFWQASLLVLAVGAFWAARRRRMPTFQNGEVAGRPEDRIDAIARG